MCRTSILAPLLVQSPPLRILRILRFESCKRMQQGKIVILSRLITSKRIAHLEAAPQAPQVCNDRERLRPFEGSSPGPSLIIIESERQDWMLDARARASLFSLSRRVLAAAVDSLKITSKDKRTFMSAKIYTKNDMDEGTRACQEAFGQPVRNLGRTRFWIAWLKFARRRPFGSGEVFRIRMQYGMAPSFALRRLDSCWQNACTQSIACLCKHKQPSC